MMEHQHIHSHRHSHPHEASEKSPHLATGNQPNSRRNFLRMVAGGALAGASVLEVAFHRAAWARAASSASDPNLFDLQKVSDGVFFAQARAQAAVNCNAAIFVRSKDVVVVDAHAKPSAAAALIAQLKREVTSKPVRYVINTHFHLDHTQGNHAYRAAGNRVDFIATNATRQLMADLAPARTKAALDAIPEQIESARKQSEKATSAEEKKFCADQIQQLQAFATELKDLTPELPTITFDNSYLLQDSAFDLHLDFQGKAHTAGDLFIFCPQHRAIATGDACMGWIPNLGDGFPKAWPRTLDKVAGFDFKHILGGHGSLQSDRVVMTSLRNYIEELTERVERAKEKGQSVNEMQKEITVVSLTSLKSNGYGTYLTKSMATGIPFVGRMPSLQDLVNGNIGHIYTNLDKA